MTARLNRGLSGSGFHAAPARPAAVAPAADAGDTVATPRAAAPATPAPASPAVRRNARRFGPLDECDVGSASPPCWHRISWHMLITSSTGVHSGRVALYAGPNKRDQILDVGHLSPAWTEQKPTRPNKLEVVG